MNYPWRSRYPLRLIDLGRSWILRHTSTGSWASGGMNVAPGTTAVLTGVGAAGGMNVVLGGIPLEAAGPAFVAVRDNEDSRPTSRNEKSQLVPSSTPDVPARRTLTVGPESPLVVPCREHLDNVRRLMSGDEYIGRGCRQRRLPRSRFCTPVKVPDFGSRTGNQPGYVARAAS